MIYDLFVQLIGFVGMGLVLFGFQCKNTRHMLFIHAAAALCYALQFFLLGGLTGMVSQLLYAFNAVLQTDTRHRWTHWPGWCAVISAVLIASTVIFWNGLLSLLPCVASIANTLANWSRNGKVIRLNRLLFASPCWILYDLGVRSISGVACEVLSMASILISIRRYGMKALDC